MKSYKDLDKEIILNAPEGAMWYNYGNDVYYTYNGEGVVYFHYNGEWSDSSAWFDLSTITSVPESGDMLPLPNIEIPWEATADSVCPVPGNTKVKINGIITLLASDLHWGLENDQNSEITSYKILDEDYLLGIVTVPQELVDHCKSLVEGMKVDLDQPLPNPEDQLTNKLKFLQNLANEFPEIKDHAVKYMKEWLDYYVEDMINGEL